MQENTHPDNLTGADSKTSVQALQRWGGLASFLLALAFLVAPLIYLTGNLRDAMGTVSYSLADFLYGPVWAAGLVTAVFALRERLGEWAPRRLSLALLAALLAAGLMLTVACIRAANRHYHIIHPDLHLEANTTVLIVWTTLVAGVSAAGWHCLGWTLVLLAWAGWTSGRLPRGLCLLYLLGGIASLFVYVSPDLEGAAVTLGMLWAVWQGIVLWRSGPEERPVIIP